MHFICGVVLVYQYFHCIPQLHFFILHKLYARMIKHKYAQVSTTWDANVVAANAFTVIQHSVSSTDSWSVSVSAILITDSTTSKVFGQKCHPNYDHVVDRAFQTNIVIIGQLPKSRPVVEHHVQTAEKLYTIQFNWEYNFSLVFVHYLIYTTWYRSVLFNSATHLPNTHTHANIWKHKGEHTI